jgi:transglycosylase associated protein
MSIIAWDSARPDREFHRQRTGQQDGRRVLPRQRPGIVGAVIGGWLFNLFGMQGVTGLNVYSVIVAVIGASVFLVVYHAIRRRIV